MRKTDGGCSDCSSLCFGEENAALQGVFPVLCHSLVVKNGYFPHIYHIKCTKYVKNRINILRIKKLCIYLHRDKEIRSIN